MISVNDLQGDDPAESSDSSINPLENEGREGSNRFQIEKAGSDGKHSMEVSNCSDVSASAI